MKNIILNSILFLGARRVLAQNTSSGDSNEDYVNSVCSPATNGTGVIPPCISITTIESLCAPNATTPLGLSAHAQCMCTGSYFQDWSGCQSCLLYHGARSPADNAQYSSIITIASNALCTGTPTAVFASLFSSAQDTVPRPTTVATSLVDVKSGDADVGLYYTATEPQGPGSITGSATAVTRTANPTQTSTGGAGATNSASRGGSQTTSGVTRAQTGTTSSSTGFAAPTAVAGKGMMLAIAGGALAAIF
ncbi:hypothetical protein B0O99DRAFT_635350 [Bisporella sp. PMI_857]|nr:hypothetical protein B0O99DRAFT_635350 [Bisporella sp. PMI_857]